MKSKILILTILLQNFLNARPSPSIWLSNLNTNFPYPLPSPIAIHSEEATPFLNLSPLVFTLPTDDKLYVTNNGVAVIVTLAQPTTKAMITGGVLGTRIYKFNHVSIKWNNEYTDLTATTLDSAGTPIEIVAVYVNSKYSSLDRALKHRDGLAVIVNRAKVEGNIPNPKFSQFERILRYIIHPKQKSVTTSYTVYNWYNNIPNVTSYYAYPGTFVDLRTNLQYEAATIIVFAGTSYPYISISQFTALQNLVGVDGEPMSIALPTFEKGERPLIQATGVQENLLK